MKTTKHSYEEMQIKYANEVQLSELPKFKKMQSMQHSGQGEIVESLRP